LLNLPLLNPDVTSFQGHSFKISVTRPLPSIIYFPHVIHLSFSGSEQPHGSHVLSYVPKYCSFINCALSHYQVSGHNN